MQNNKLKQVNKTKQYSRNPHRYSGRVEKLVMQPYYNEDGITIYNADCLDVMIALRPVDVIITDPPYGINGAVRRGDTGKNKHIKQRNYIYGDWDAEKLPRIYFEIIKGVSKNQIIFGGNYYGGILGDTKSYIVWDKDNGDNFYADCELAWTNYDRAVRKIKHKWHGFLQQDMKNKEYREHPTQKPLPVMRWIIENYTEPTDLILDPFMGSGTTLVAAKQLGRKAVGIEINKDYCDIAVKRLNNIQGVLNFE